jgi:hypothetical protein
MRGRHIDYNDEQTKAEEGNVGEGGSYRDHVRLGARCRTARRYDT